MASPTIGSARSKLRATVRVASSTATEAKPSARACRPAATSAAEQILRLAGVRYRASCRVFRD
jgi:hypothetical protein